MHTIIHRHNLTRFPGPESPPDYRTPHYDCTDLPAALHLTLYVPGVDAHGVDLVSRGPDLIVTARKTSHLRANWTALHLERVQRDYQLKLRLGSGFNFPALQASISRGVLTIVLPKNPPTSAARPARQRQVA